MADQLSSDSARTVTVADALELECVRRGSPEVVAGTEALDRRIRWAHVGEVRHLASTLRGGELVLTTGIALGGDDRATRRFVADLAERRVAGLIVQLGDALAALPQAMIETAERHALPLVALHREVPFVEVTEAVNSALLDRRMVLDRRLSGLQDRFTALMLDGAGIPEVLNELAGELRNPVLLERADGELLFHAVHSAGSGDVLDAWDSARRDLSDAPESVSVQLPAGREAQPGNLVTLGLDNPLDELSGPALARAAALIAVVTRQSRHDELLIARERGNLLAELMDGELSESDIARHVQAIGFPARVPYLLPCILAGPANVTRGARATVWAMAWREIRHELEANAVPVLGGLMPGEGRIAMVLGLPAAAKREPRADAVAELADRALERQFGIQDAGLLYVGDATRSWTAAIQSLREVRRAASSPRPEARGWHDATRPDIGRLLWELRDRHELRAFVERRLGPLLQHDTERPTKLLPTLETYLECGGRKTDTARILHLERQSLYHRISRIETLLGDSLDDADTRLGTHLAIRARRLLADDE